ncbi:hypothetical protein D6764_05530 [Candidatus Woesearchaeota archaeon]|nr:MAG: hypothetical protein D6764_05530 [Candidatus Woesearchaeota archaeon]
MSLKRGTMLFGNDPEQIKFSVIREGEEVILRADCENSPRLPLIEDDAFYMAKTIEELAKTPDVTKLVFSQKRDYEYDFNQTQMLVEIARLYAFLLKQNNIMSFSAVADPSQPRTHARYPEIRNVISNLLKSDPLGAYVELKRIERRERIELQKTVDERKISEIQKYLQILQQVIQKLEETKLIILAKPYLAGYRIGDRSVYRKIFSPTIKPDFMFTKLMANYPIGAEEVANYTLPDDTEVTIFRQENNVQTLYHILPPEFKIDDDKYELLDMARNIMAEHKPRRSEFVEPERMRQVFYNVGHDLIEELANYKNVKLTQKELKKLTEILVRYTVGFGLIEVLLQDEKVQDISVNSPLGQIPIFLVHGDFDDCVTNIIPTRPEAESWASKLRMISGRPLDEADPILDTELELPGASTRVSVIAPPLNPTGLGFSFRRHRDKPWTLPLFIKVGMLNSMAAGLFSFLIDGTRTMLIAGTRSSGKSSLLSALMVEIMRRYRIITVEDTLELPTASLRKLGFNIQPMKVASALARGSSEMSASDGIRATLRLGDSSLIVGEVRSAEAKALYEAMRVGAAANVVAGTIHGDSPYGIFDRVVNDIGVPKTSFKATDIIIIANPIKSADGLHRYRRVIQVTEVRKTWEEDPLTEGGFVDLMKYDAKEDTLKPMDGLINGESEILKTIAANVKDFAGNWDAVWDNIMLRARIKQLMVDYANKVGNPEMLEAPFVISGNDQFHIISERVRDEVGSLDSKRILFEWEEWIKGAIKRGRFQQS